ncbi:MAG: PD-(D/E)XK nuclease family protein [Scytolyngbya sp. HA4215-MV1]|nr:PD-(D/E)XK nuclease family protein [Scytolyngbya sp. HA4215-MV1]
MQLSQGQLNLLETCPRKFQHTYLEQLGILTTPEQQERLLAGSRFHQLMQQRELDLPIAPLLQADPQLQGWYTAFAQSAERILSLDLKENCITMRQSEYPLSLEFSVPWEQANGVPATQNYLLVVVYDLLIWGEHQARILDWKTYPRPQNGQWLQQDWQTRLYPFVLAETSDYLPEQISMTYWFFQAHGEPAQGGQAQNDWVSNLEPQSLNFPYSATQHEQTRQDLTHLLSHLAQWLYEYQQGVPLPQVPVAKGVCQSCSFAWRCQRKEENASAGGQETIPLLAEIQEVAL